MGYPIFHSQYTAAQIEASIGKTPRIRASTRTWLIWDIATSAYVDTGVSIDTQLYVDPTLTESGYAADARVTGIKLGELRSKIDNGLLDTDEAKEALLACFAHVAWIGNDGQDYYDALYAALYPPTDLVSISAVYTQPGPVYNTDTLNSLRNGLVVTATYSNSSTEEVTTYTLSGTLTAGTSTITVRYGGKTTTFNVTVTSVYPMTLTANSDGVAFGSIDSAKNYETPPYVSNDNTSRIHAIGTNALGYPINYGKTYRISGSNVYAFAIQCFGATGQTKLQNVQALTAGESINTNWITTSNGVITFTPTLVNNEEPVCMWIVCKKDSAGTGIWNALSDVLPITIEEL